MINSFGSYVDGCARLDVPELRTGNLVNLLIPCLFYACRVQGLHLGQKPFLASAIDANKSDRLLARFCNGAYLIWSSIPHGKLLRCKHRVGLVEVSVGDHTFHKSWGRIGLVLEIIGQHGGSEADIGLNIWKQPKMEVWDSERQTNQKDAGVGRSQSQPGMTSQIAFRRFWGL